MSTPPDAEYKPCPGCGRRCGPPHNPMLGEWMRQGSGQYLHFEMSPDGPDWVRCKGDQRSGAQRRKLSGIAPEILRRHYLFTVECDHQDKKDRPVCACAASDLGRHDSVEKAVAAWIEHVVEIQRAATLIARPPSGQVRGRKTRWA